LGTWLFATLAWMFFFSTISNNPLLFITGGLFMGFIILSIDRALIKGINAFTKNKITPLLFRGLLAITIGTFMAQPTVLLMFDKEIRLQTSIDNEKRKMIKHKELEDLYKDRKAALLDQKTALQKQLDKKYTEVSLARESFIKETDGSGGSGKVGIKAIAQAKRNEYEKLDREYQAQLLKDNQQLEAIDNTLKDIEYSIQNEETVFLAYLNDGFLTRVEALNNLLKSNAALQFRYYLIIIILLLIELMPLIAKLMLPSGSYDEKVRLREALEKAIAEENNQSEKAVKFLYTQLAKNADTETLQAFFDTAKEYKEFKLKQWATQWQEEKNGSLDDFWTKVKKNILTKQEN
jgi:hypothetical protein